MKVTSLRSVAVGLSIGWAATASAQFGSTGPTLYPPAAGPQGHASRGYSPPRPQPRPQAPPSYQQPAYRPAPPTAVSMQAAIAQFNANERPQNQAAAASRPPAPAQMPFPAAGTPAGPVGYRAPAKWDSFNSVAGPSLLDGNNTEMIPTPTPSSPSDYDNYDDSSLPTASPVQPNSVNAQSAPLYSGGNYPAAPPVQPHAAPAAVNSSVVGQGPVVHQGPVYDNPSVVNPAINGSPYVQAAAAPWAGDYTPSSFIPEGSCGGPECGVAAPVRAPLSPWFGSVDLLFYNFETNGKNGNLASRAVGDFGNRLYLPQFNSSRLDPGNDLGYRVSLGRYLGCGRFGLGVTYFSFDPDPQSDAIFGRGNAFVSPGAGVHGDIRAAMPHYRDAKSPTYTYYDGAGHKQTRTGDYTAYKNVDGTTGYDVHQADPTGHADADFGGAARVRGTRNVDFDGLEVNLFSFGLMGAQRASALGGGGFGGLGTGLKGFFGMGGYKYAGGYGYGAGGYSHGGGCGQACGGACGSPACGGCAPQCGPTCGPTCGKPAKGYGGAGGPLVRPCSGKVQVITSCGFRWFRFQDELNLAYDIDNKTGYGEFDLYDDTRVENNLYGYQFGSSLVYCLTCRLDATVGGRFGIYGNEVRKQHRLGSLTEAYTLAAMPDQRIAFDERDTVLSTLGELDLGLGYRLTNAFTLRGGYTILGVSGVATSLGNQPREYSSFASASAIHATDSVILHGAYLGASYNW